MNKKQMVLLWILGIWISVISFLDLGPGGIAFYYLSLKDFEVVCKLIIPPLIIGGLLIYTLRTRK